MSTEAQALAILKCPRCGAAVAVSTEPQTKCAYCQADVEVPEAYGERCSLRFTRSKPTP